MLLLFVANLVGLATDSRLISGAPAWLKPAKFAISTAIFAFSIAWILRYVQDWPKIKRAVSSIVTVTLSVELLVINLQAWRGMTSHFNIGTPLDATLWFLMGAAIFSLLLGMILLLITLFRQRFESRTWGWALRLGLLISVLGAGSGGLMTKPTPNQLAQAKLTHHMPIAGSHIVGAPDGGSGLPGTGWSTQHGDLRVPHFLGLHALQIVPFLGWLIGCRRRWTVSQQVALVFIASASYLSLIGLLIWQALRGQSLVAPDNVTLLAWTVWLLISATLAATVALRNGRLQRHATWSNRLGAAL